MGKNHANYECSQNIPDTSMKLFMNPNVDPTGDLPNTASTMTDNGYVLVHDFQEGCQAGTDDCGFQNCRKFCENTDKATGFGDFTVPTVDASGWYTFVWYWIFNPGTPYISFFEAYIDIDGEATTPDDTTDVTSPDATIGDYLTKVPVCVTGATYDETDVSDFATAQFEATSDSVYILSQCDAADADGFEFTVQVKHSELMSIPVVAIAQEIFCDAFEAQWGSSVSWEISDECGEISTFATYEIDGTPSPTEADLVEGAIQIINDGGAQAYYYPFVIGGADECADDITSVQILKNGAYFDNDQYYYDNGHKYAFNYGGGETFQDLLPITLRLVLSGGEVIVLENVVENLNGGATFTSSQTCSGTDIGDDTPAPTIADEGNICSSTPTTDDSDDTPAPTTNDTPAPTTDDFDDTPAPTTDDFDNGEGGGSSAAVMFGARGFVGVFILVLFWI